MEDSFLKHQDFHIRQLFPTQVGFFSFEHAAALNPQLAAYLLNCERHETNFASQTTVRGGWQSALGLLHRDLQEIQRLRQFFDRSIASYLAETHAHIHFQFTCEAWAVILRHGGYQHQHVHTRTDLVGVYCVAMPSGLTNRPSGQLSLIDPRGGRLASRPMWESDRIEITPQPGQLVLFPSYLPHRVDEVLQHGERITINFDVSLYQQERPLHPGG